MIHEVDAAVERLLRQGARRDGVEVTFDAPTRDWASRRSSPTLDVYLYDIREDVDARETAHEAVRGDNGRIVARRPPPRWYRLSYLVTAWTKRPEDEHRILAQVLATVVAHDALPAEVLTGGLAAQPYAVRVSVALPPPEDRSISDIWTALGGELKPSLELVVTAPLDPGRGAAVEAGPILEPVHVNGHPEAP